MSTDSDELDLAPDFKAPLRMLKDASTGLLDHRAPVSKERVEGLYRHLAGAVGQILDAARKQLSDGMEQFKEANPEVMGEDFEEVLGIFEQGQAQIDSGMRLLSQTFFAATDLKSLERNAGVLSIAESQIQDGMNRLETALALTDDPTVIGATGPETAPEVGTALDSLSTCLDCLSEYLQSAEREKLEVALVNLDQARQLIVRALAQDA